MWHPIATRRKEKLLRQEQVDRSTLRDVFLGITARLLWRRPPILFTEHGMDTLF
jgi:hypothetical protein